MNPNDIHKERFIAALAAFLLGGLGLHRFYLGSSHWWWYPVWLVAGMTLFAWAGGQPTAWWLVFVLLPVWLGFVEAMAFGVMQDDKWDAKFNPNSSRRSENGWNCIFIAIASLLVGATLLMATIVLSAQFYYESLARVTG